MNKAGVSNPRPARLYFPDHGHVSKYVCTMKITQEFRRLGAPLIDVLTRVDRELTHNDIVAFCNKKIGGPWKRARPSLFEVSVIS